MRLSEDKNLKLREKTRRNIGFRGSSSSKSWRRKSKRSSDRSNWPTRRQKDSELSKRHSKSRKD